MQEQFSRIKKIILCKQNNFAIKIWPVNDLETAYLLIYSGIDGIITENQKILMPKG